MRLLSALIFSIVCFQCAFATDYWVSTPGNNARERGSQASPWRKLRFARTRMAASQGHTIRLSAGPFVETRITAPSGVSIPGAPGGDRTMISADPSYNHNPASSGFGTDKFFINLNSATLTHGNQGIKYVAPDGDGKKLHGGIYVKYRTSISTEGLKIRFINFVRLGHWGIRDFRITGVQVKYCAWESATWSAGRAISIFNRFGQKFTSQNHIKITRMVKSEENLFKKMHSIHRIKLRNTDLGGGFRIVQ